MSLKELLKKYAIEAVINALSEKNDDKGFKEIVEIDLAGETKTLFLVGYADRNIEDGSCIAILNPEKELLERIKPNVAYSGAILKEIIAKKCEFMVQVWVDAYKKDGVAILSSYRPRSTPK